MTGDPWRPDTGSGAEPRPEEYAQEYAADDAWNAQQQPAPAWDDGQQAPTPVQPDYSGDWQAQPTQYIPPQHAQ